MKRHICIHGHFYQPPRENAWLEEIEVQDSASPYHDWNERVCAESYEPNTASRILDSEDRIIDIMNNYAKISFDAGPTLLGWLEKIKPGVYQAILQADRESCARHHGHGGAIAQGYNHIIMPLADSRDKQTQILWGMKDFESRFGRMTEGMWLPETAVDLESLDLMAKYGIKFTILSPYQASQTRRIGTREWKDASRGSIDPKMPYLCRLPSGRSIVIFFYDGPISRDVAFGGLLQNGEQFAKRLLGGFSAQPQSAELLHLATDGETYGHHHRFGDMALAYCINYIETNNLADLTVYGDYLEQFPPTHEARILENTAWSCFHGVERWRSDCGDSTGMNPRWNQKWRAPLRDAMDWLRDNVAPIFESGMKLYTRDPWRVRDDYIQVILDRSPGTIEAFLSRHTKRSITLKDKIQILKLCEIQRHAMLIFTSDGWFFDDISNVETIQVMQYAARTIQLLRDIDSADLEPEFIRMLEKAKSNVPEYENGARIYEQLVKPSVVDFLRLGAHYAVSSLFQTYPKAVKIAHYAADSEICEKEVAGKRKLAVGKVKLKSEITWEERAMSYAVLHLGDQNLVAGVKSYDGEGGFQDFCRKIKETFSANDITSVIRLIDQNFGDHNYSLWHLFKDEKRKVLGQILEENMRGLEVLFRQIFEDNYAIMQSLKEMQIPLPEALSATAEFVLNADFRSVMEMEEIDLERLRDLIQKYVYWSFKPNITITKYMVPKRINALMHEWQARPEEVPALKALDRVFSVLQPLLVDIDLRKSQNIYFQLGKELFSNVMERADEGETEALEWLILFDSIGKRLRINPDTFRSKQ